jgi:hypothetical protein
VDHNQEGEGVNPPADEETSHLSRPASGLSR